MNIKTHKNKITIIWASTEHFLCSGRKECVPALRGTVLGHSATPSARPKCNTPHTLTNFGSFGGGTSVTRAIVSDLFFEVPRTHTAICQRTFTCATVVVGNIFIAGVHFENIQYQMNFSKYTWLRLHPP